MNLCLHDCLISAVISLQLNCSKIRDCATEEFQEVPSLKFGKILPQFCWELC
jgi:hypothetical protein